MAATAVARRTVQVFDLGQFEQSLTVLAAESIKQGALVALDAAGLLVDATGIATIGPFYVPTGEEAPDNPETGSKFGENSEGVIDSAVAGTRIQVKSGLFWFVNGESIVDSDIGELAYADDNQTIFTTAGTLSVCGVIKKVDTALGVLVDMTRRSI